MARYSQRHYLKLLPLLIVLGFLIFGLVIASRTVLSPTQLSSQAAKERCRIGLREVTQWENRCESKRYRTAQYQCWDGSTGSVGSAQGECLSADQLRNLARERCGKLSNCPADGSQTKEKPSTSPKGETPVNKTPGPEKPVSSGPSKESPSQK